MASIVETSSQEQPTGQSPISAQSPSRAKLVQRLLGSANSLPQFVNDLLATMAVVVAGTEAAGFLIERTQGEDGQTQVALRPIAHIRPDDSDADVRQAAIKAFTEIIQPCVVQNKDGAIEVGTPDEGEPQFCLVTLLRSEGQVVAVAAVVTRCLDQERAKQRLQSMQLVAGYFEMFTLKRNADQLRSIATSHQNVLQLTAAIGSAEGFESAAMNLCNELASRTGASRVSLGWRKGSYIRVKALSHTEKFDKKQELIVQVQKAMEECADQEEPVRVDFDGERTENVTRDSETLSRMQGGNSVLSLPLRRAEEVCGVLTLEFAPPTKLNPPMIDALVVAADVLTPQVFDRHENDRNIVVKVGHSIHRGGKVVLGPKHMVAKMVVLLLIAAACFVTFFKPMYHVSAPFVLGATEKRAVSVPFEGKIKEIGTNPDTHEHFKAGDVIRRAKGQAWPPLVRMETDDLFSKLNTATHEYNEARGNAVKARGEAVQLRGRPEAAAKYAEASIYDERAKGAESERALYTKQLAEAEIRPPADWEECVIVKGDFEDKVGQTVRAGEDLFVLAQKGSLRLELAVPERDIHELKEGQRVSFATNSQAHQSYPATVTLIVPMADPKEGDNTFKAYARPDQSADWMRAGMAGEARVDTEPRRLVWIWTHRLVDFLRLKLWM